MGTSTGNRRKRAEQEARQKESKARCEDIVDRPTRSTPTLLLDDATCLRMIESWYWDLPAHPQPTAPIEAWTEILVEDLEGGIENWVNVFLGGREEDQPKWVHLVNHGY